MTRWFAGVMLVLALAGCGGGGGDVAATPGNSTIVTAADKGNIVISLTPGEATTAGVDAVKSALPAPTHVRVVVRNPTTNFKAIQDVATAGASSVVIPVPVGTGYLIDGLSYVTDGSSKRIAQACPSSRYQCKQGCQYTSQHHTAANYGDHNTVKRYCCRRRLHGYCYACVSLEKFLLSCCWYLCLCCPHRHYKSGI